MKELFLFICNYVSPIFLGALLIWRFKGRLDWIFPTVVIAIIGFVYLPGISFIKSEQDYSKLRSEIETHTAMKKPEIQEIMKRKGITGEITKSGILIYPADKHNDYWKYYLGENLRFIIAFKKPNKYDQFCTSLDSLMIRSGKIIGCPKDTAYELNPNCFVCKSGYDPVMDRFILKVSRKLNFNISTSSNPKTSKPKPEPEKKDFSTPRRFIPPHDNPIKEKPKQRRTFGFIPMKQPLNNFIELTLS